MRLLCLSIVMTVCASAAVASEQPFSSVRIVVQPLVASAASALMLPETKGRKGSTRVGGSNSKGKGSRYVGGRR